MVQAAARKPKTRTDVFKLQIRQLVKNLLWCKTIREKIQNVTNTNSEATNAWAPTALLWINSDSLTNIRHLQYLLVSEFNTSSAGCLTVR